MKNFLLIFTMIPLVIFAQNSVKIGLGLYNTSEYSIGNKKGNAGSIAALADYNYSFDKNLVSASLIYSPGFNVVSTQNGKIDYMELGALYGRDLELSNYLGIETFAGISYWTLKDTTKYYQDQNNYQSLGSKSGVGFPIRVNILLNKSGNFNFGVTTNYNINGFASALSGFLVGRFKF